MVIVTRSHTLQMTHSPAKIEVKRMENTKSPKIPQPPSTGKSRFPGLHP